MSQPQIKLGLLGQPERGIFLEPVLSAIPESFSLLKSIDRRPLHQAFELCCSMSDVLSYGFLFFFSDVFSSVVFASLSTLNRSYFQSKFI